MTEIVIVADDLTGAADCAVPFVPELNACLVLDVLANWPGSDVVSVDTDSRYTDAAVAAERVETAVLRAEALGAGVFKKVDSALRGNVAVEVQAALRGLARRESGLPPVAIVSPAFPAVGRITVGGRVRSRGLGVSAVGPDLLEAFSSSGHTPVLLSLDATRKRSDLIRSIATLRTQGSQFFLIDSRTDSDLDRIVEVLAELEGPTLAVGSGGMARALARRRLTAARSKRTVGTDSVYTEKSVLFVIGSYSTMASAQRSMLVDSGVVEICLGPSDDLFTLATRVRSVLRIANVVLTPTPGQPFSSRHALTVADMLARVTVMSLDCVHTLVATGGETARAILTARGTYNLTVKRELEPGVVAMRTDNDRLDLVVKSGSFGDPATLCRIIGITTSKEQ